MEKIPEQIEQKSKKGHHDKENRVTNDESRVVSNMAAANNDDLKGKINRYVVLCTHVKSACVSVLLESFMGERWSCCHCKFSNHPLMSRCEACNCPNR